MENIEEIKNVINTIETTELVSDEELKEMDFFELAYYMQTLNQLDEIKRDLSEEMEESK